MTHSLTGNVDAGGDGVEELPQQRRAIVGIAGEQFVQEGGARAAEAGDHDRRMYRFSIDRRLTLPELDQAEPVLKNLLDLAPGTQAAGKMQLRLVVERAAESREWLLPPGVTEVIEPGGRCGRVAEKVRLERDHRAPAFPEPVPDCDELLGPGAAWRRSPGHGLQP